MLFHHRVFLLLLLILISNGCTSTKSVTITPSVQAIDTDDILSPTEMDLLPSAPSKTPLLIEESSTPSPVERISQPDYLSFPTPILGKQVNQKCIPLSNLKAVSLPLEGSLVLDSYPNGSYYIHQPRIYHLASGEVLPVMEPSKSMPQVSPDGKHLFVIEERNDDDYDLLNLVRLETLEIVSQKWPKTWGLWNVKWFDDHTLVTNPPESKEYEYGTTIYFDPFTRQTEILHPAFQSHLNRYILSLAYDPHKTYAFFMDGDGFSLIRLIDQNIFFRMESAHVAVAPTWDREGERVYFVLQDKGREFEDVYVTNLNGEVIRITQFSASYNQKASWIRLFKLSSNASILAIQYSVSDDPDLYQGSTVGILNLNTKELTDTCVIAARGMVWSPDGTKIAVTIPADVEKFLKYDGKPTRQPTKIAILDLVEWKGWILDEDAEVIGWVNLE